MKIWLMIVAFIAINGISTDGNPYQDDEESEMTAIDEIADVNAGSKERLFEVDMKIENPPEEISTPFSLVENEMTRRELRTEMEYLWIDREIPYEFTKDVEDGTDNIIKAMKEISDQSCIKFIKHSVEKHWIKFVDKGACFSTVGRRFWRAGAQEISLSNRCQESVGTIMHEILHALGFFHEQSRGDRDQYVEILWENIREGEDKNFARYGPEMIDSHNSPYDTSSVMHYGKYTFSKNGKPTLQAINEPKRHLGQRVKLSKEDVIQLNLLYKCKDQGDIYTQWSDWSHCDSDNACRVQRQRFCSHYDRERCPDANSYGVHTEYGTCSREECYKPRNGHWGRWSSWSECSKTCGGGLKTRARSCDDPSPKHGGTVCEGPESQEKTCYVKSCSLGPDDCEFDEQGLCFWKEKSKEAFKWKRIQGKTPSRRTGPNGDHTSGKGFYLYTEASKPADEGMKAVLQSKIFPPTNGRCLIFSYNMHGIGIGGLRVYLSDEKTHIEKLIWEKEGAQGEDWITGIVTINNHNAYSLIFEAERGSSFVADIALDDVFFHENSCDNFDGNVQDAGRYSFASDNNHDRPSFDNKDIVLF